MLRVMSPFGKVPSSMGFSLPRVVSPPGETPASMSISLPRVMFLPGDMPSSMRTSLARVMSPPGGLPLPRRASEGWLCQTGCAVCTTPEGGGCRGQAEAALQGLGPLLSPDGLALGCSSFCPGQGEPTALRSP